MHAIWVRLQNFYARKIEALGKIAAKTNQFLSIAPNAPDRNTIIFEEARKIVPAAIQELQLSHHMKATSPLSEPKCQVNLQLQHSDLDIP